MSPDRSPRTWGAGGLLYICHQARHDRPARLEILARTISKGFLNLYGAPEVWMEGIGKEFLKLTSLEVSCAIGCIIPRQRSGRHWIICSAVTVLLVGAAFAGPRQLFSTVCI